MRASLVYALGLVTTALAARQPYDVRKIIDAFRRPRDDLTILCAHRGLKWNGTAENSRDAYFRASEAGLECIETDIRLSNDNQLPMVHDSGLGRVTDAGEQAGRAAYNPFTGKGYDPKVADSDYSGYIENLHLRDEQGRARVEQVPTLPDMYHDTGMNVVLELDFKDQAAVEPAYWALKDLKNTAGVPANEWCIYKLQASWYKTPEEFESLPWVRDAFANGVQLAFIPVYDPGYDKEMDQLASLRAFARTNYTISAEIELRSTDGVSQELLDYVKSKRSSKAMFRTAGAFFAIGDFFEPVSDLTFFDTGSFSLPEDIRTNNSVYVFQDNEPPALLDDKVEDYSVDGHDYRSDFNWLMEQGFNWIITDTPDVWDVRLKEQGKRNIQYMIADGEVAVDGREKGWYKRDLM